MLNDIEIKNDKVEENLIPLSYDYKFKKLFGDNDAVDRLEQIISLYFQLPIEEVKGNINILNSEKLTEEKKKKKGAMDIYLRLQLKSGNERVDIEVSDKKLSQSIIDRNLLYGVHKLSTQLQKNEDYSSLEPIIIINFNVGMGRYNDKDDDIVDKYLLRNNNGHVLTEKLQFHQINIEKCYKLWYSNRVNEFDEYNKNMIIFGALLRTRNRKQFSKCLEELPMDENVKKDIEKTNFALNEEIEQFNAWYDYDRDQRAIRNAEISDAVNSALIEAKEIFEKEKNEAVESAKVEGISKRNLELAKIFKDKGVNISIISESTGLSISEIEKL